MPASLIRSHTLMTGVADRFTCETIEGGAVLQEDGVITAIGSFAELSARHPTVPVIGTGREVVLPGFVNAHHHVGLTPVQLGSPDMPLELWFITRMVIRNLDLYLDTLYSAFEMVGSGVTTVQHIQSLLPGTATEVEAKIGEVIRAYEAIGMRVSYCYGVRDQNRLVYQADADLIASLPAELQDPMKRYFDRFRMNLDETMGLFESLHARHQGKRRVKIQLAPANLHWCSDTALGRLAETSERFAAPMHMHLVETAYQKEYAARRGGGTAVDYLDRFGLVNERLTIGHGVWLSEPDIDRLAEAGSCICHNCSSNFRLRSASPRSTPSRRGGSPPPSASTRPASTTTATCCRSCAWCCAPTAFPAWSRPMCPPSRRSCAWRPWAARRRPPMARPSAGWRSARRPIWSSTTIRPSPGPISTRKPPPWTPWCSGPSPPA